MRPHRTIALLFILVAIPAFSAAQEKPRCRACQLYELQGPVHTQLNTSKKLNEDPPGDHKLSIRDEEGWLVFDPNGDVVERGEVDQPGEVKNLVRSKYDAEGQLTEWTFSAGERTLHFEIEKSTLPSGTTQTLTLLDGKPFSRHLSSYNAQTGDGESMTFDTNREMSSHVVSHRSPLRREMQSWGKDGKFGAHTLRRYDDRGELIESVFYDSEGRVVSDFSFRDNVLTSWWQDPKCNCTNGAGFHRPGGVTISYRSTEQGKLFKNVQHHKGRQTNHEIDDEELYDENGRLLERIAYTYERDQYGNWIRRVTSMLDIKTGEMILVREDTRKLTYY